MPYDAIRWLIKGARCRNSQRDRWLGQVVFGYSLIIVIEVQLSVKMERLKFAASAE
jgi:hypothetical protein